MLTQADVEDGIEATVKRLEELTDEYAVASDEAAEAEASYRLAFWHTFLRFKDGVTNGKRGESDRTCEGRATIAAADSFRAYKITAARVDSLKAALRTHQTRLDALRTLAANIRSQT